ncbi:hypothetical protein LOTGIDRAFT_162292 [Lottia gigantea]|uniref:Uncharacterized protein n=1 Tax=Lottia gigantea TaxID=225164 RepID=V4ACH8_LOTGI|nr:hypothetical protein LOTGIDRAFT_162292 [Lottia gigantea]ESO92815.1 hypothetical protein LOTGIDRAFT_162292 [Lottia gigantea]
MAALFKKALMNCFNQNLRPNKVSSVYDCCFCYWLPIDDRMWSGEVDFIYIENWAEDVDFTEDDDLINSNVRKSTTRSTNRFSIGSYEIYNTTSYGKSSFGISVTLIRLC